MIENRRLRQPKLPDTELLIGGQKDAYQRLTDFIKGGEQLFCFEGYAGVGKSFSVNMFVEEQIARYGTRICIACPTHKALRVLVHMADFESEENLAYLTVHSLLGLKPIVTDGGVETFVKDRKNPNKVGDYDLIIIDEASMLDDKLFAFLLEEIEINPFLKIIFVGDGKQLPPVHHKSSAPMDEDRRKSNNIGHSSLTEIVRQKGTNPIIKLSKEIREGTFRPVTQVNDDGHGVMVVHQKDYKAVLEKLFTGGKYDADPNHCRVVAWTNNTVNGLNTQIRKMIYKEKIKESVEKFKADGFHGDDLIQKVKEEYPFYKGGVMYLPKYVTGDKVIVDKPIFTTDGSQIEYQTNEELIIQDYTIEPRMAHGEMYDCYIAQIKNLYTGRVSQIEIVHEDSYVAYEAHLERLKKNALRMKRGKASRDKWVIYYKLDKRFARLKYAPCLTTYKSQGSTYDNIIIIARDIMKNPKKREVLQHLYVGVTRASARCFIFV